MDTKFERLKQRLRRLNQRNNLTTEQIADIERRNKIERARKGLNNLLKI